MANTINDLKDAWYKAKGYTAGNLQDNQYAYFKAKSGETGTIHDLMYARLGQLGFTGSIGDRLLAFYKTKVSGTSLPDLEYNFFSNTALDFS